MTWEPFEPDDDASGILTLRIKLSSVTHLICAERTVAPGGLLIESFNGKPQASLPNFAYACGSPLNENAQYATKSKARWPGSVAKAA